jgi:hypothetical protein
MISDRGRRTFAVRRYPSNERGHSIMSLKKKKVVWYKHENHRAEDHASKASDPLWNESRDCLICRTQEIPWRLRLESIARDGNEMNMYNDKHQPPRSPQFK